MAGDGVHELSCMVVDLASNAGTGSATVKIDRGVPSGSTSVFPAPNANGWHSGDVTLRAVMSAENVSGIDFAASGCTRNGVPVPLTEYDFTPPNILDIVVHDDGIFEYVCTVVTPAGLSSTSSATVKIDRQGFDFTMSPSVAPDEFGWHDGPVTLSIGLDLSSISGLDLAASQCTRSLDGGAVGNIDWSEFTELIPGEVIELVVSGNGIHEISCNLVTNAGVLTADSITVQIDDGL